MSEHQKISSPSSQASSRPVLRRKCTCGAKTTSSSGICAECARKKLQPKLIVGSTQDPAEREAERVANAVMRDAGGPSGGGIGAIASIVQRASTEMSASDAGPVAPPIVDQVLARPGQTLDPSACRYFERRFGRDFGSVRVHTDAEAAASTRAVDAHAYTVGNHVVFGASRYAPDTTAGRHLLAHELTHVVQQGATLRRDSLSPPVEGEMHPEEDNKDKDKQAVQRLQRRAAIVGLDEAGPNADLTGKKEAEMYQLSERDKKLAECKKAAAPDPILCDPTPPPGWASFTATPVASSPFGAVTFSSIKGVDVPSKKCEQSILGYSGPTKRFQGVFAPDKSWVKARSRDAADPTKNGSVAQVTACEQAFDALAAGQTGSWALITAPDATCPASARPRGDRATKKAECSTIVAADFNDWAVAESMRLLKHEQTHLALTCAMAKKGNDALDAGSTFDAVDATIHTKLATAQQQYDGQSHHGCTAAQQTAWEAKIAAGLPDIRLP